MLSHTWTRTSRRGLAEYGNGEYGGEYVETEEPTSEGSEAPTPATGGDREVSGAGRVLASFAMFVTAFSALFVL